jgi:hypothetical protein
MIIPGGSKIGELSVLVYVYEPIHVETPFSPGRAASLTFAEAGHGLT